jgi:L-threonylcarbamoyladenylate synthase
MKILAPTDEALEKAAHALVRGDLVGIPTETVYGIAADATNELAVQRIFAAKERPADNPLIVHVSDPNAAYAVAEVTDEARSLMERFWPGPLTLVLYKTAIIPAIVSGGRDTVAVRMPDHPVALALLTRFGRPVAAPSANRFMGLSPTRAEDIDTFITSKLELILDGGPCRVGIESTVLDLTGRQAKILRPGAITADQIAAVTQVAALDGASERKSPGMYARHYAPNTPVRMVDAISPGVPGVRLDPDVKAYAAALYRRLHELDLMGLSEILVEAPPDTAEWEAVWDRLRKAAHGATDSDEL